MVLDPKKRITFFLFPYKLLPSSLMRTSAIVDNEGEKSYHEQKKVRELVCEISNFISNIYSNSEVSL